MHPDDHGRINGTTYPRDRAPLGSEPLSWRQLNGREIVARFLARAVVRVLRPQAGDVLVVAGDPATSSTRREIVYAARAAGCTAAVFVQPGAMVHMEPRRLDSEDRGYKETKNYSSDKDGPAGKHGNKDRGVYIGTPDDVPDSDGACEP